MRISDWSSDVCSSDLQPDPAPAGRFEPDRKCNRRHEFRDRPATSPACQIRTTRFWQCSSVRGRFRNRCGAGKKGEERGEEREEKRRGEGKGGKEEGGEKRGRGGEERGDGKGGKGEKGEGEEEGKRRGGREEGEGGERRREEEERGERKKR